MNDLPDVYKLVPSTSAIPWMIKGPGLEPKYLYFTNKATAEIVVRALNQAYAAGHTYGRTA